MNFLFKALGAIKLYLPPGEARVMPLTYASDDGDKKAVDRSSWSEIFPPWPYPYYFGLYTSRDETWIFSHPSQSSSACST